MAVAYDVSGAGPTVVLQHGLTSRRIDWVQAGYVDALSDAFQVVTIDSLGHGDSGRPTERSLYRREQRAGDVIAVLDDLHVERAHFVGHSMAAWVGGGC